MTKTSSTSDAKGIALTPVAMDAAFDQTTIYADAAAFQKIIEWMDAEPTAAEHAGMNRLLEAVRRQGDNTQPLSSAPPTAR